MYSSHILHQQQLLEILHHTIVEIARVYAAEEWQCFGGLGAMQMSLLQEVPALCSHFLA